MPVVPEGRVAVRSLFQEKSLVLRGFMRDTPPEEKQNTWKRIFGRPLSVPWKRVIMDDTLVGIPLGWVGGTAPYDADSLTTLLKTT